MRKPCHHELAVAGEEGPDTVDEEHRVTAPGLAGMAGRYLEAALLVGEATAHSSVFLTSASTPAYHLGAHAIELTLKAYLRHRGYTARRIRGLNHCLRCLYEEALREDLAAVLHASKGDQEVIHLLWAVNEFQALRYPITGRSGAFDWRGVVAVMLRLHRAVAPLVGHTSPRADVSIPSDWWEELTKPPGMTEEEFAGWLKSNGYVNEPDEEHPGPESTANFSEPSP